MRNFSHPDYLAQIIFFNMHPFNKSGKEPFTPKTPMLASAASQAPTLNGNLVFAISRTTSGKHFKIYQGSKDGPCLYFAQVHYWRVKKPSVELREGDSKEGEMIAFSHIDDNGGRGTLAFGNADRDAMDSIGYDTIREKKPYAFREYEVQSAQGTVDGQRLKYCWARKSWWSTNIDCRDVTTGEELATYRGNGMFKPGTLTITAQDPPKSLIIQLLLSLVVVREMEARILGTLADLSA
jgi:hypothetical protein